MKALDRTGDRGFWSRYPDANIAVRTDKFFVIDIDLHGKHNGFESLRVGTSELDNANAAKARTASGECDTSSI